MIKRSNEPFWWQGVVSECRLNPVQTAQCKRTTATQGEEEGEMEVTVPEGEEVVEMEE